jgi:uncharacterized lipoprotein YddW (UPF0748 family)
MGTIAQINFAQHDDANDPIKAAVAREHLKSLMLRAWFSGLF